MTELTVPSVAASQEDATKQKKCDIDQLLKYKKNVYREKITFQIDMFDFFGMVKGVYLSPVKR